MTFPFSSGTKSPRPPLSGFARHMIGPGLLVVVALLAACTVRMAPAYDPAIANGLNSANRTMQTFFAGLSETTTIPADFAKRQGAYADIIGALKAVSLQIEIHQSLTPQPDLKTVNAMLGKLGVPNLATGSGVPGASAVSHVVNTLETMEKTDRKHGLSAMEIAAFDGQATIYMSQAITYETFLKR